jgi:hypothetical protein
MSGWGMWQIWELESLREGDRLEDPGIDGWITLKLILKTEWDKWQVLVKLQVP